jgi:hypothetical protein
MKDFLCSLFLIVGFENINCSNCRDSSFYKIVFRILKLNGVSMQIVPDTITIVLTVAMLLFFLAIGLYTTKE